MKKILITGATGFLGTALVSYLMHKKWPLIKVGYQQPGDVQCDLTNPVQTQALLNRIKPDVIVHLAALTDVDRCQNHPESAYLLNVKPVENIVTWLKTSRSRAWFLQISTDQVYDGHGPHREDSVNLKNTYAFSKYCAEQVALQARSVILRTNFFGKSGTAKKSLSDWLIESFEQKQKISLFTDVLFNPVTTETLCKLIEKIISKPVAGIYNVGSHGGMSKRDFAHHLAGHLNLSTENAKDALVAQQTAMTYRPRDMRMDVSHFEKVYKVQLPKLIDEIGTLRRSL